MKPRAPNETAENYIARLEASNASLRADNARLSRFQRYCVEVLSVSASRLGLLLDYAADLCGEAGAPEHLRIKQQIDRLCGLSWAMEPPALDLPKRIDWRVKHPDPPSDAGMILRSALERAKAERAPWERSRGLFPNALPPVETWDARTIWWEVSDALTDLEFSRACLRDDLRSAMFDHCIMRIARALHMADEMQPPQGDEFSDDDAIPF